MTIFWRCQYCFPDQSHTVDVPDAALANECYRYVLASHFDKSPNCVMAKEGYVAIDFLIRRVQ